MDPNSYRPTPTAPYTQPPASQVPASQPSGPLPPPGHSKAKTIGLIVSVVCAVVFAGLFAWAFMNYRAERDSVQQQINTAVQAALEEQAAELQAEFQAQLEADTVQFRGPDVLGRPIFAYPKNWSVYQETGSGRVQLDVTIHPKAITDTTAAFALRFQVQDREYDSVLGSFQKRVEDGDATSKPASYGGVDGVRINGEIGNNVFGTLVLLPVRDKTILFWTESDNYLSVYERALESLQLSP